MWAVGPFGLLTIKNLVEKMEENGVKSPINDFLDTCDLRHLIFNSNDNGFDHVVKRVGRRVLIDEEAFYEWVEKQNQQDLK